MKIAVTGDATFWDLHFIYWKLNRLITSPSDVIQIITRGGYAGIEKGPGCGPEVLAERWAFSHGFPYKRISAKAATEKSRRIQIKNMFREADKAIIFWDGDEDSLTQQIIKLCKKVGHKYSIVRYKEYK